MDQKRDNHSGKGVRIRAYSATALLLLLLMPTTVRAQHVESGADGPDHRYGLRVARQVAPGIVRLTVGSSFVVAVGTQPAAYRVVSETDPQYRSGQRPTQVTHTETADDAPPPGWQGKRFLRHTITLTLSRPLRSGNRYAIQMRGVRDRIVTGGRAAVWIETLTDLQERRAATEDRLAVRQIEMIAPTVLALTVGDSLDTTRFDGHPETIVLRSSDDPVFKNGRPAVQVGRRSRGDCFYPDGWPFGYYQKHELFLVFDRPLQQRRTYTLDLNAVVPLTGARSRAIIIPDDRATINPAIKVNQVGYLPDAPRKYAYLGAWMGSLGALDFAPFARQFEVRDAVRHQRVLMGPIHLRHQAGDNTEGSQHDLSGEVVYEMDLSGLRHEGHYYIAIPGMGRSYPFRIARTVYDLPFRVMMNGVFHQRCGLEIKAPYSRHYRPACHRNRTELTNLVHGSEADAFRELPNHVIAPVKYDLYGGHHDAGDYNPRAHLDIAALAFFAYEIRPDAFYDGQLNIPEARNGIPDILDEGRWALDLWVRLQDADGGVRNGTESNGDPDITTPAEEDNKRDFAFAKDAEGSLRFAATAAQAALIWESLGRKETAQQFLSHAVRAWDWAMMHGGDAQADAVVLAAVQLYRATGQLSYRAAFERHSVFSTNPNAELDSWQQYDQRDASFYYAFCRRPVDPERRKRILDAFARRVTAWDRWAETQAYRYLRNPSAPNTWGTGAHPIWLIDAIQAFTLLHTPEYRNWAILTCDWALGCSPLGTVFTTRLGQRPIHSPLHIYSRYSANGPIAGIQCEGPSPRTGGGKATAQMSTWIGAMLYPDGPWPELQTYSDVEIVPEMTEGIVTNQMKSAVAYAFLLPLHRGTVRKSALVSAKDHYEK